VIREYSQLNETVALLRANGANTYRFSIAWTRLVPGGFANTPINKEAVDHYNLLLDLLKANNITPFVTIYHFDLPAVLQKEYRGLLNTDRFVADFTYFAEKAFRLFGGKVKHWITFNEPITQCLAGYGDGQHAPGRCINPFKCQFGLSPLDVLRCGHTFLIAHAHTVDLYRKNFQKAQQGKISMANHFVWGEPISKAKQDVKAAQNFIDSNFGWMNDPLYTGDYPGFLKSTYGRLLPKFTSKERALLKGSFDFVALNQYTTNYIGRWGFSDFDSDRGNFFMQFARVHYSSNGEFIGLQGAPDWLYMVPWGFKKCLIYIKNRYNNPEIYVTENGFSVVGENNMPRHLALHDAQRVEYFKTYLSSMQEAMKAGARVKGYMAWSIIQLI
jgi:beta-glucosidase